MADIDVERTSEVDKALASGRGSGSKLTFGEQKEPQSKSLRVLNFVKEYSMLILTVIAAAIAIVLSIIIINATDLATMSRKYEFIYLLGFPGLIFLRLLQLLVIPLIMVTIAHAVGTMNVAMSGAVGLRATIYYLLTTFEAVLVGIVLAVSALPTKSSFGSSSSPGRIVVPPSAANPNYYTLLDVLRNVFPSNVVQAFISQERIKAPVDFNKLIGSQIETTPNPNIMGLLFVAICVGLLLSKIGKTPEGILLITALQGLNVMLVTAVRYMILVTPFGVLSLLLDNILRGMGGLSDLGISIAWYFGVVTLALAIQLFIVFQVLFFVMTRQNPFKFFNGMLEAWVTSLATASSNATLPLTMYCLEKNNNVDERVSSFVASIGATVNMNGTACYEGIAAIFLARMTLDRTLTFGDYAVISIAATMAGVGAAGIPSAGLVTMVMVLNSIGVDPLAIGLIMPVDFILDRFRTSVNIMGDAYGAGIINHWMRGSLERDDQRIAMQRKSVIEKYRLMSVRPSFRRHTGFAGRSSGADV